MATLSVPGSSLDHRSLPLLAAALAACSGAPPTATQTAARPPVIDRFSASAGKLMQRSANAALPAPGAPIDLDRPPFITQGLGPDGSVIRYYHFDVQPAEPATLYRLTRAEARERLPEQLDIVDVVPGEAGYSDFWRIAWVEVPDGYAANTIASAAAVRASGFSIIEEPRAINCPVVPAGSTAREGKGVEPAKPTELWYRGARISCLAFGEPLGLDAGRVPSSPIYVAFNHNPGEPGGGPESGFRTEQGSAQTHNVVGSLPGDSDYSPLWDVHIYDVAAFASVRDAATAQAAPSLGRGPLVNCPVVAR